MKPFIERKPFGYWTKARCKASAAKYLFRTQWARADQSPYLTAYRNGWLDECCAHMPKIKRTHDGLEWSVDEDDGDTPID